MKYYSAIKKNEILPFIATWMDLKIVILNEVKSYREREISRPCLYAESKKGTNELMYKTKIKLQM